MAQSNTFLTHPHEKMENRIKRKTSNSYSRILFPVDSVASALPTTFRFLLFLSQTSLNTRCSSANFIFLLPFVFFHFFSFHDTKRQTFVIHRPFWFGDANYSANAASAYYINVALHRKLCHAACNKRQQTSENTISNRRNFRAFS